MGFALDGSPKKRNKLFQILAFLIHRLTFWGASVYLDVANRDNQRKVRCEIRHV